MSQGYVSAIQPLHENARCCAVQLVDVDTGRVVLSDLADADDAEYRATLMAESLLRSAGGAA